MRHLNIGTTDNANRFHDGVGITLQTLLQFLGNGEHWRGTEGIPRMYAHRVDIFNEADGNHIAFGVPHHFQL